MDKHEFVEKIQSAKRIVIKIGSAVLSRNNKIDENTIENIVSNIAEISENKQVLVVSSGAVASGISALNIKNRPTNIVSLQALASIGQPKLVEIYAKYFKKHKKTTAQVLITVDDIQNRRRFINAKNTIITLLKWKVVPVVNENDTVVIKELRFGDNDNLSFQITNLIEADALIILSNIDGVYTKEPSSSSAEFIEKFDGSIEIKEGSVSKLGSGGIGTKIDACLKAAKAGKLACILNGKEKDALKRLIKGGIKFTFFEPYKSYTKSKKSWIESCNPSGVVVIDKGAKNSLRKSKSLLPSGIKKVFGGFGRGDIINIEDEEGFLVAKGITNYDSSEIEKIRGHHSNKITAILGYKYSSDVVHIDNMVIMENSGE